MKDVECETQVTEELPLRRVSTRTRVLSGGQASHLHPTPDQPLTLPPAVERGFVRIQVLTSLAFLCLDCCCAGIISYHHKQNLFLYFQAIL